MDGLGHLMDLMYLVKMLPSHCLFGTKNKHKSHINKKPRRAPVQNAGTSLVCETGDQTSASHTREEGVKGTKISIKAC